MRKVQQTGSEFKPAPITTAVARFSVRTQSDAMPDSARQVAQLSLLDWIAVAIAGREERVSRIVRKLVADEGGTAEASVIGLRSKLPARAAALANGTTSHALDYDDTHFVYLGHPSVAVLPAAIAIAEKTGATGSDFLEAAMIGFETACRIGAWLGRRHYQHGFHQTATSGSFGAASAAARLLRLDEERTCHALGLTATRASGLKSQFGTMGKPFHAGMAAANGVEAALLAAKGFISRPDGLECALGFANTHAGEAEDPALVLGQLGEKFILEAVQHKFYACCHGTHAALEALIEARESHCLKPKDVQAVTLTVHPSYLSVCNIEQHLTGLEAKFSYRLTTALALSGRDTGLLSTFSDEICHDPNLIALRGRVTVVSDTHMSETAAMIRIKRYGCVRDLRLRFRTPRSDGRLSGKSNCVYRSLRRQGYRCQQRNRCPRG